MNRPLLLGVGLGAILAVAVLGARSLVNAPIDVPAVELPPPRAAVLTTPTQIVRSPELAVATPSPAPAAPASAVAQALGAPPPPLSPPTEPPVAAPTAPSSPFADEHSRELEYAFMLATGPDSTVASAQRAAEIFERCLKEVPTNHRCYEGLTAAQARQQPDWVPPPARPTALAPAAADPVMPLRLPPQLRGGLRRLSREQREQLGSER